MWSSPASEDAFSFCSTDAPASGTGVLESLGTSLVSFSAQPQANKNTSVRSKIRIFPFISITIFWSLDHKFSLYSLSFWYGWPSAPWVVENRNQKTLSTFSPKWRSTLFSYLINQSRTGSDVGRKRKRRPIKVNKDEFKKKSSVERFFSWKESCKKVFPKYEIKEISYPGVVISNNEVNQV